MAAFFTILQLILKALGLYQGQKTAAAAADERRDGEVARKAVQQEQVIHEVEVAAAARTEFELELARRPSSLRDDDGFKRPS